MAEIKKINTDLQLEGRLLDGNGSAGTGGQVLSSTGTATDWVSLSEISGVDGTGTANYIAKWSDGDTITNSVIYDNGGNVGIGTTSPGTKLHVGTGSSATVDTGYQLAVDSAGIAGIQILAATNQSSRVVFGDSDDNDVGMLRYDHTDNSMRFITNGSGNERMRITSAGNVGIGTTSPGYKLHVTGDASVSTWLYVSNIYPTSSTNDLFLNTGAGRTITINPTSTGKTVIPNGNVGIGTTSPSEKLQIYEGGNTAYKSYTNTNAGAILTSYQSTFSPFTKTTDLVAGSDGTVPSEIRFLTRESGVSTVDERMRINSSGNVGIGTTSPSNKLEVVGDIMLRNPNGTNPTDAGSFIFNESGTTWGTDIYGFRFNLNGSSNVLTLQSANTTTVNDIISFTRDSANVGIGTTSPNHLLHVSGNASVTNMYLATNIIHDGDTNTLIGFDTDAIKLTTAGSERLRVTSTGNVGIGTTSPSSTLHVADTGNAEILTQRSSGAGVLIQSQASVGVFGTNTNHRLDLKTNGGTRFTIDTAGNVGIGTTSPGAKLHVAGDGIISGELTFKPKAYQATDDPNNDNRSIFSTHRVTNTTANRPINYSSIYTLGGDPANALQISTNEDYSESGMWIRQYNQNPASPQGTGWQNWTEVWTTNHAPLTKITNWDSAYTYSQVGHLPLAGGTLSGDLTVNGGDIILGGTGRIQGVDTVTVDTDAANKLYVDNAVSGLVTGVSAGDGIVLTGTAAAPIVNIDYVGTDNAILSAVDGSGSTIALGAKIWFSDDATIAHANVSDLPFTNNAGDITGVTAGTNINGGGTSGTVTLNLDDDIVIDSVEYTNPSSSGQYYGEIAGFGGYDGGLAAGDLAVLKTALGSGQWFEADYNTSINATGMLGIYTGSDILLRGKVRLSSYSLGSANGVPLYMGVSGAISTSAPTGNGDFVRIIGYVTDYANDEIYFCPDNTWVEITA